jgi:hypothetical protein
MKIKVYYALGAANYGRHADLDAVAAIASAAYGPKRIIGGSHTRPLQAALLRAGVGRRNESGKSLSVTVAELVSFARELGDGHVDGTNIHNHISAEDVLRAIATPPPWYDGPEVDFSGAIC